MYREVLMLMYTDSLSLVSLYHLWEGELFGALPTYVNVVWMWSPPYGFVPLPHSSDGKRTAEPIAMSRHE